MNKKHTLRKICITALAGIIISSNCCITLATTKSELQDDKKEIDQQIKEAESDKAKVTTEKTQALKEIEKIDSQISDYQDQINELDDKLDDIQSNIKKEETNLQQSEEEYKKQKDLLDTRLVTIYESGDVTYLDVLLSSTSITDLISKYYLVSELATYDTDLLNGIETKKNEIENIKQELEKNKKEIETTKTDKQKTSTALKDSKATKNTYVSKLTDEEKSIQSDIDQFEQDKRDIENQIRAIAKREAAKAAEEAKNNSKKNNNNSNSGGSGNSGNTSNPGTPGAKGFIRPVSGYSITTGFGAYKGHTGADFSGGGIAGKPVYAAKAGTVVTSKALKKANGEYRSYGEYIMINHHDGTMTLYAHGMPNSRKVSEGQSVSQGQVIMNVGTTGNSTGYHLHFEIWVNGKCVNPASYL